jgi:hypothetical protein
VPRSGRPTVAIANNHGFRADGGRIQYQVQQKKKEKAFKKAAEVLKLV